MATDAAVSKEGLFIPLIDFSKFLEGTADERATTAKAILDGFQTAGFVYLKNHEVPADKLRHTFSRSADFFDQPLDAKLKLGWTTPEANRGYSSPGREKVTQEQDLSQVEKMRSEVPDLKESFEIGRDSDPAHSNPWPPEEGKLGGFRADMVDFFDRCQKMHRDVMRAIALGMGLDEGYFDGFIDDADNTLRLLHYPEVKADVFKINPGQVRAGEHSDYGSVTLLFQDNRGGLQVRSPNGQFVDATPIEGTVVINAGDLLARWSNDTIKSTIHRVVEPPRKEGKEYPPRYSIAYFCNPNFKDFIETLPGTYGAEQDKKYGGVNSGEYLVKRLTATY
ncbi:2OG-Fe(II) oxygenase superfamily protein [Hirsutella rhossiliensis]|uniref:2OG-Fe(II) oxygenase superfamily domain-containing protein n=1 Tax=Hirsutella rhossiliensis TaxID=111463 RepID=A0A9P8MX82_9HYPO|nr:2OG-Fe(II) oxygenase superfamily domain-containing protein [Hirsutella rhossiliensis]KAH0962920.1 2OG-Fe(II) oxygenase superfamily domain-containing protein [Hirsutella rhossiliensis]